MNRHESALCTSFAALTICSIMLFACSKDQAGRQKSVRKDARTKDHLKPFGTTAGTIETALSKYVTEKTTPVSVTINQLVRATESALGALDFELALALSELAVSKAPNNGYMYYLRGMARFNAIGSNEHEALADLLKSIKMGDCPARGYDYTARILDKRKESGKAIEILSSGLRLHPKDRSLRIHRAALFKDAGDYDNAEKDYDKNVELHPDKLSGYHLRTTFLEGRGRFEEALADYETALKLDTIKRRPAKLVAVHKSRARLLIRLGRNGEALEGLNQLMALDDTDDEALTMRGKLYASKGQTASALKDFTRAIDLNPRFAVKAYEGRSSLYKSLGKTELAGQDSKKARQLKAAPAEVPIFKMK